MVNSSIRRLVLGGLLVSLPAMLSVARAAVPVNSTPEVAPRIGVMFEAVLGS